MELWLIQVACDTTELDELVLLELLSERNAVVVLMRIDRGSQRLKVFLIHVPNRKRHQYRFQRLVLCVLCCVQLVKSVVNCGDVSRLNRNEVLLDERQMTKLSHKRYNTRMIHLHKKNQITSSSSSSALLSYLCLQSIEQIASKHRLLLEVELDRLVGDVGVRDLHHDLLELAMLPTKKRKRKWKTNVSRKETERICSASVPLLFFLRFCFCIASSLSLLFLRDRGVSHHNERSVVKLVVVNVQEAQLAPLLVTLTHAHHARNVSAYIRRHHQKSS